MISLLGRWQRANKVRIAEGLQAHRSVMSDVAALGHPDPKAGIHNCSAFEVCASLPQHPPTTPQRRRAPFATNNLRPLLDSNITLDTSQGRPACPECYWAIEGQLQVLPGELLWVADLSLSYSLGHFVPSGSAFALQDRFDTLFGLFPSKQRVWPSSQHSVLGPLPCARVCPNCTQLQLAT